MPILRPTIRQRLPRSGAAFALSLILLAGTAIAQDSSPIDILTTPTATDAARLEAASTLLTQEISSRSMRRLVGILGPNTDDPVAQRLLLLAIAARPVTVPEFEQPLIDLVARGDPAIRPQALLALASAGTWDAARVLVNHAAPFQAPEVSKAAVEALVRMTGRDDLGNDVEEWRRWLDERSILKPEEWQAELIRGLTYRNDRLSAQEREATTWAVDGFRRLFMVAPYQDKSPLLAQLLLVDGELRQLAIELINRELAQGNQIDEVVGAAALKLLEHEKPAVRSEAARLIQTLSPPNAGVPVTEALVREVSPIAAAGLLNAAAKWPGVAVISPALRWLEFGAATRDSASKLLLSLDNEGLLTSPVDRRRIASALRAAGPNRLTTDGVRLIIRMGNDDDRDSVAGLLLSGQRDMQAAAASELARRPEFFDRVVSAAERDPALYQAAVSAAINHRRTPDGYALIRRIAPNETARRSGVLAMARSLGPKYVLEVARVHETDPELRVAVLSTIARAAAMPNEIRDIDQAMILLAESNLELSRPENALNALASVSSSPSADDASRVVELRTISLLWLNRIDEALDAGAGVDVWLAALDRIGAEPHAEIVAQTALNRFGNVLSTRERDRLQSIITVTEAEEPSASPTEGG
ncbi:MAG: hypothetical protein KDA31_12195 [Phycisphaerales bacterium]|nr:hypothetical protein [Phycisphaerales bacterium]